MLVNKVRQDTIVLTQFLAHLTLGTPCMDGALPRLNPTAASFTPTVQPASLRPSTPPSLERLVRELKELKSSGRSNKERLAVAHDERRQLLSHMSTAKAEIDGLERRLQREESIEGSQDILNRLKELNGLHGWVGQKCTYIVIFPIWFQDLSCKTNVGVKIPLLLLDCHIIQVSYHEATLTPERT